MLTDICKILHSSPSHADCSASVTWFLTQTVFSHLQHRFFSDKNCRCGEKKPQKTDVLIYNVVYFSGKEGKTISQKR